MYAQQSKGDNLFVRHVVPFHIWSIICVLQNESQIFPPTTGGGEKMAADMDITFLGKLPLDPRIGKEWTNCLLQKYKIDYSKKHRS